MSSGSRISWKEFDSSDHQSWKGLGMPCIHCPLGMLPGCYSLLYIPGCLPPPSLSLCEQCQGDASSSRLPQALHSLEHGYPVTQVVPASHGMLEAEVQLIVTRAPPPPPPVPHLFLMPWRGSRGSVGSISVQKSCWSSKQGHCSDSSVICPVPHWFLFH